MTMKAYEVTALTTVRETYFVVASSEPAARQKFDQGLVSSPSATDVVDSEVESVKEVGGA